jgi:hypothetical protein
MSQDRAVSSVRRYPAGYQPTQLALRQSSLVGPIRRDSRMMWLVGDNRRQTIFLRHDRRRFQALKTNINGLIEGSLNARQVRTSISTYPRREISDS